LSIAGFAWRSMTEADLDRVEAIAEGIHGTEFYEPREVFAERLALFPEGCRVAANPMGVVGYAIAHPAWLGRPPALAVRLGALPEGADALHFHDVALLPEGRRSGLGGALVEAFVGLARDRSLPWLSLIAVHGSLPFWQRHGFAPGEIEPAKLASYGSEAAYLVRPA